MQSSPSPLKISHPRGTSRRIPVAKTPSTAAPVATASIAATLSLALTRALSTIRSRTAWLTTVGSRAALLLLLLAPQLALLPWMRRDQPASWYVRHTRMWLMAAMVVAAWAL